MKWQFFPLMPRDGYVRFLLTAPRIHNGLPDAIYNTSEIDYSIVAAPPDALPEHGLAGECRVAIKRLQMWVPDMMDNAEVDRLTAIAGAFLEEARQTLRGGR